LSAYRRWADRRRTTAALASLDPKSRETQPQNSASIAGMTRNFFGCGTTATRRRPAANRLASRRSNTSHLDQNLMPVDLIHLLIGIAFVVVWGLACRILLATQR
jgi:hypothetical protein